MKRPTALSIVDGQELSQAAAARYVGHTYALRNSPAWRCLPDNARRVVDRLEVQHLHTSCVKNGQLVVTYADFERAGIRRSSIRLAIEQAVALGFVEIVRRGYSARGNVRVPSLYRLTHVKNLGPAPPDPTNEWQAISTEAEAGRALRRVAAEIEQEQANRRARKSARRAA